MNRFIRFGVTELVLICAILTVGAVFLAGEMGKL
jgi:hypothetical protein